MPTKPLPASIAASNFFPCDMARPAADALRSVAGGVEDEAVVLVQVAVEHRAVLAADDLEAVLLAKLGENLLGEASCLPPRLTTEWTKPALRVK